MSETEQKNPLDPLVGLLARLMDALGMNGTRLRWRWNRRKARMAESGAQASVAWRSAKGKHKMCPSCRALVPRTAGTCPECGTAMASVRAPGLSRMLANVFPGATATTSLLLLVNGALFLLMLMESFRSGEGAGLFGSFNGRILDQFGAAYPAAVVMRGEWWLYVTAMFLHGGLLHFFFNSYCLLSLGPLIESEFGTERFWVVYFLSGVIGNVVHIVMHSSNPVAAVVGASGAICGLVGLLIAYGSRVRTPATLALRTHMIRFSILILVISFLPGISMSAHVGGFLTGFGLGWVVPTGRFRSRSAATGWQALSLGAVLVVLYSFYKIASAI